MKTNIKLILLVSMTFLSNLVMGQNSGQNGENESLRLVTAEITPNYQQVIRVYNKQTCDASVDFNHNGSTTTKLISALSYDTFRINLPECVVKAKPRTNCGGANMGWVEYNVCQALPMKFAYIKASQSGPNEILVEFKPLEIEGKSFFIQYSKDGLNFKRIKIILPADVQVGKAYSTKIKID